ncbi:hypothetical protein AOLI_G00110540 [Acnodon oligacanthus]
MESTLARAWFLIKVRRCARPVESIELQKRREAQLGWCPVQGAEARTSRVGGAERGPPSKHCSSTFLRLSQRKLTATAKLTSALSKDHAHKEDPPWEAT